MSDNDNLFHYQACGLPKVWLADGVDKRQTPRGPVFHIDHVKDLHRVIRLILVKQTGVLSPDEFRFLRT
ncbi:MAG: hypothetical protein AAGG55_08450 [Pseudomonadota bacterium]